MFEETKSKINNLCSLDLNKKLYLDNIDKFVDLQDNIVKKGNDQTPVNYIVRNENVKMNLLDKTFNMTHLQRKEVLQDFMFVECGYVWHFNGFDKHHREPLMKDTWDKIKKNYEK